MRKRSKRSTKRLEVARQLENQILTGHLKPGTRLKELRLASELGVSQASIREALQHLESRGLIVKYPNRGSFVLNLEASDLVHIYQVRSELEPLACALAAEQIRQETIDMLQSCIDEMEAAADRRDYLAYSDADLRFHRLIWQSQPNRYLEKSLTSICLPLFANDLLRRYPGAYLNFAGAGRQHRRILAVLKTRDASLVKKVATRLMRQFLRQDLTDFERLRQISEEISAPAASVARAVESPEPARIVTSR